MTNTKAIPTDLPKLVGLRLDELRGRDGEDLDAATREVLRQVSRPRANLGGSGPPGRAD